MNPFKYARMEKGYKQYEVADLLKVSRSHIAMIESDKTIPNGKILLELMYILEVKPQDLLVYYKINNKSI